VRALLFKNHVFYCCILTREKQCNLLQKSRDAEDEIAGVLFTAIYHVCAPWDRFCLYLHNSLALGTDFDSIYMNFQSRALGTDFDGFYMTLALLG